MKYWLLASIADAIALGFLGVAAKLSLRHVTWPVLILSSTLAYIVLLTALGVSGKLKLPNDPSGSWFIPVVVTGGLTGGTFALLASALEQGPASQVVPITAGYPVVTALLSVAVLSEGLTFPRIFGIILVVIGVILVAR